MEFRFTAEQEAFRAEVRQFLAKNVHADRDADGGVGSEAGMVRQKEFEKALASRGWLTMAWPREFGGQAADQITQLVFNEELALAGGFISQGSRMVGPCVMIHGTDEQKRRFLPPIARGEVYWAQAFSEPGAGSDLASVQTRAVRDGDDYVINGQKIWTSGALYADALHVLARTDPDAPKHQGISYFLVDRKSPGITIEPIRQMTGGSGFNQTFFDNVRVPRANMLGAENRGWYVAATTLDFERSNVAQVVTGERNLNRLIEHLRQMQTPLRPLHPALRHSIADLAIGVSAGRLLAYRVAWLQAAAKVPNYEASMSKLYGSELAQRIANVAMRATGLYGQLEGQSPHAVLGGLPRNIYLGSIAATIAAGTSEIQRNVIATRGLGLPRG